MACSFCAVTSSAANVPLATNTFSLSVPFIVNTQPIQAGKEVILTWTPTANKRKESSSTSENAFDQILRKDKKERRMAAVSHEAQGKVVRVHAHEMKLIM